MALDCAGKRLLDSALPNDETKLRALISRLKERGQVLLVVDQPATVGDLPVAVARAEGVLVAYLPGLAMRRIADLYAGEAKTDARDAYRMAQQLAALRRQREEVAKEVERLVLAQPLHPVLRSMPGVGVRTAARLLIDVVTRAFASAGNLAAYAGLAPVTRRSGSSIPWRASFQARQQAAQACDVPVRLRRAARPNLAAYYERKISQGKRHNQALIALARRCCDVLFAMLRDGTLYNPPQPEVSLTST